jgi:type VI secretion system secreted protein VgrG
MPSPKSGKAGTAVAPAEPKKSEEADKADPGEVEKIKAEQRKTKTGKYGSEKVEPHKKPTTSEEQAKKLSWIEIKLVDEDGEPVPGEAYRVTLPDGETVAEGTLDDKGYARVEGFEPGQCQVTFPNLDESVWEPK